MANRGVDWDAARHLWLAQPPPRSYQEVARQVGVSGTRVRYVARRDGWPELADEIDAEALAKVKRRMVLSREQRIEKTLGIVDGLLDRFDDRLDDLEVRPADLPALVKLAELLVGEATDRMSFAEVQEALSVVMGVCVQAIRESWPVDRFLAVVRERLGVGGDGQAAAA